MKINAEAGLNRIMFLIVNRLMHLDTCRHEQTAIIPQKKARTIAVSGHERSICFQEIPWPGVLRIGENYPLFARLLGISQESVLLI